MNKNCLPKSGRGWLLAGLLSLGTLSLANAQGGTPGNNGPSAPAATAVPLDGGASLLLAAGVGFGLKKLRQRRQAR